LPGWLSAESVGEGEAGSLWALTSDVLILVVTLGVFIGCRRKLFPLGAFVPVALLVEIVIALGLGTGLIGWQYRLASAGVAWQAAGGAPPFNLGAGEVPWVGIWIILFATIIPLGPRLHLLGGVLSALTLLIWPAVSVAAQGVPAVIGVQSHPLSAIGQLHYLRDR